MPHNPAPRLPHFPSLNRSAYAARQEQEDDREAGDKSLCTSNANATNEFADARLGDAMHFNQS